MSFLPGWKVLLYDSDNNYVSCFANWDNATLRYRINQWTIRKFNCGPLAVFNTLDMAIRFCNTGGLQIEPCLYILSLDQQFWFTRISYWGSSTKYVNQAIPIARYRHPPQPEYPQGTTFADAVKLIGDTHETSNRAYVWT